MLQTYSTCNLCLQERMLTSGAVCTPRDSALQVYYLQIAIAKHISHTIVRSACKEKSSVMLSCIVCVAGHKR